MTDIGGIMEIENINGTIVKLKVPLTQSGISEKSSL